METFGTRLRALRNARGLTQQALAGDACSRAYVSTVEADRAAPSPELLEHFATTLGLTVAELRTGPVPDAAHDRALRLARAWLKPHCATFTGGTFWDACGQAQQALDAGRWAEADQLFTDADRLPDAARHYATARRVGCLTAAGEPEYAAHLGEGALAGLPAHPDPDWVVWLCAALQEPYRALGATGQAEALRTRALLLGAMGPEPGPAAAMLIAHGAPDRALALLVRWPLLRLLAPPPADEVAVLTGEARALAGAGRLREAIEVLERACAIALGPTPGARSPRAAG
ncbi:helix-turn-helix transcriptional regulator [Longispora sp. K20-0274]|uniref:helix-turn-helix domain-containing protein n=1 Tax=Longispora sp. K20-0274 TaxID=3088255 RepID=UPI0039994FC2